MNNETMTRHKSILVLIGFLFMTLNLSSALGKESENELVILSCSDPDSGYMKTFYLTEGQSEEWSNESWRCSDNWTYDYYNQRCINAAGDLTSTTQISRRTLEFTTRISGSGIIYGPLEDEVIVGKCSISDGKKF